MYISVVIPFYNEADNIDPLFKELLPVLTANFDRYKIICVDDGSRDQTVDKIQAIRADNPNISLVKLSRNFGKDAALSAGIAHACGDALLIMDADLQHPPSVIPEFLEAFQRGTDIVYGLRKSRAGDGRLRRYLSSRFYGVYSSIADVPIPANAGDFRLMSRRAYEALQNLPENNRFMKGLYAWIGFSTCAVEFDVAERRVGASKWSIWKLLRYAWGGVVSFSSAPLRASSLIGFVIATLSAFYAVWIVGSTLIFGRDLPGYATLATSIFFLGGLQLLSIGILGEYVSRIFEESKRRPPYIVESFDDSAP
ncbi:MAG: glycosyltransferase family 2 protein [Pseudomonadota bacterium]